MPRIIVNAAAAAGKGDVPITINERPASFFLRPRAPKHMIQAMEARSFDLLLIAASVFTADALISRGGNSRADFGEGWYRDLRFVIPVREVEFWRGQTEPLANLLEFLTGDRFEFSFVHRAHKNPAQSDLLQGERRPAEADRIILFSGGLDSLTGALDALLSDETPPILVTHCSASKTISVQKRLFKELAGRFPGRVTWAPAIGTLVGKKAKETTQRSRSFFYAALGYAAASVVGASRISFCENGIVSVNLPISRQVIGTMATRTTHPLFLHRLQDLLSKVAGRSILVDNPYAWLTKTEVVTRLRNLGGADLIAKTNSCSSVRARTQEHPLCGCCSQCLDRRFAVLAADLAQHDPAARYEVDLFLGQRKSSQERTMANEWTRHAARRLCVAPPRQFQADFAAPLADVAAGYPQQRPGEVLTAAYEMHRRHGMAVNDVLEKMLRQYGPLIIKGAVPEGSLLATVLKDGVEAPVATVETIETDDQVVANGVEGIFPLRLTFDPDGGPRLHIVGLGDFSGKSFQVVGNLRPYHEEDRLSAKSADKHRFIPTGRLGESKASVRQHVNRCRAALAETYKAVEGELPDKALLIESGSHKGYRLDPTARFVEK